MAKRADLLAEANLSQEAVAWADIKNSKNRGQVLYGTAIGIEIIEQGGNREECLKLNYNGIYGYLPKRLIDTYTFKGLQNFVGKVFEFVVIHVDLEHQIFAADRIQAIEKLSEKFWREAKIGESFEAFVRGVDPFNVYLLVEGVPAKMHRNEFSYTFHEDLTEEVSIGDIIDVKLMDIIDEEKAEENVDEEELSFVENEEENKHSKTILVSKKALETNPWKYINEYKEKSTYLGVIRKVHIDHGLFIDLQPRNISIRCNFPPNTDQSLLRVGEQVNVKLQVIDIQNERIQGIVITPRQAVINRKKAKVSRRGLQYDR